MDLAADAAIPAAIVATLGAGIAVWQTTLARAQAQIARDAAESARRQAAAADEQVELMRRQLSLDEDQRDDARRPRFELSGEKIQRRPYGLCFAAIVIKHAGGAPLKSLQAKATGEYVTTLHRRDNKASVPGGEFLELGALSPGAQVTILVDLSHQRREAVAFAVSVELELIAVARDDDRRWVDVQTARVVEPPRPRITVLR